MASIPCAAYQAGHIHYHLRKQHQMKTRGLTDIQVDPSPPPSPGGSDAKPKGFFVGMLRSLSPKAVEPSDGNKAVSNSPTQQEAH